MKKLTTAERELLAKFHEVEQEKSRNKAKSRNKTHLVLSAVTPIPLTELDLARVHPLTALYWSKADNETRRQTAANLPNYLTDTATAAIVFNAAKIAYNSVNTNYARSGQPMMWNLLQEGKKYMASYHDWRKREFAAADYLIDDCEDNQIQKRHIQKKRRIKLGKKRVFVPCRIQTAVFTETGKNFMAIGFDFYNFFEDLVSVATLALLEHAHEMTCLDDIWHNRRFAYRAINREIHAQKKQWKEQAAAQTQTQTQTADTDTETAVEFDRISVIDSHLVDIMNDAQITAVVEYVKAHCNKRVAAKTAAAVAAHIGDSMHEPLTVRETAAAVGMAVMTTQDALKRAAAIMETADGMKFLRSMFG